MQDSLKWADLFCLECLCLWSVPDTTVPCSKGRKLQLKVKAAAAEGLSGILSYKLGYAGALALACLEWSTNLFQVFDQLWQELGTWWICTNSRLTDQCSIFFIFFLLLEVCFIAARFMLNVSHYKEAYIYCRIEMQNYLYRWHVLGRKSVVRLNQEDSFRLKEEITHLTSAWVS